MYVLGFNGNLGRTESHDPAAFLLRDGKVVYGAEEERFTRVKYAPGVLPARAIHACLGAAGVDIASLDGVAFPQRTWGDEFAQRLRRFFELEFGRAPRISYYDHHLSHAASTFFGSGYPESLVVTMDGSGDGVSTATFMGSDAGLQPRSQIRAPDSLGFFYSLVTQYLGFVKNSDEYKVMALAAYGTPQHDLSVMLHDTDEGFALEPEFLEPYFRRGFPRLITKQEPIFSSRVIDLLGPPRLPSEPLTQRHRDVAASFQARLEAVVVGLVERALRASRARHLCLAGGVALNGLMNAALARLSQVEAVYVPPVPNDAGCALGAAMLLTRELGGRVEPVTHAFLGDRSTDEEIRGTLASIGVTFQDHGEAIVDVVTEQLAKGRVVGWVQGAMEVGPRALGARSLLADPRSPDVKDRINRTIKQREAFQPLAPTVLRSGAEKHFDLRTPSPFMSFVVPARPGLGEMVPAVLHVDGTARVQTLDAGVQPRYERLLRAWGDLTGIPMLLNTSLNRRGEPIVRTPAEALGDLFTTPMDGMALGTCYVTKR